MMAAILSGGVDDAGAKPPEGAYLISVSSKPLIDSMGDDYSFPAWTKLLKKGKLDEPWVGDDDIKSYVWATQSIYLTPEGSKRLGPSLRQWNGRQFLVSLGGKALFAGSIVDFMSARYLRYPVIYVEG